MHFLERIQDTEKFVGVAHKLAGKHDALFKQTYILQSVRQIVSDA